MKYVAVRKELTIAGETYKMGDEIKNFEEIPSRNQYSLINLGWVKTVADHVDEPTPTKNKTRTNIKRKSKTAAEKSNDKGAVEKKEGE